MIKSTACERLEWPLILDALAALAQSQPAREACQAKQANLSRAEVAEHWAIVEPIKELCEAGKIAPIGDVLPMDLLFRAAEMGQVFTGEELRQFLTLLYASRNAQEFATDHLDRCPPLRHFKGQLYSLPKLINGLEHTLEPDGTIKDTASKELASIRSNLKTIRAKTEDQLRKYMGTSEVSSYLQDDFFTLRNERYVIPMTLDGRGRLQGNIIDTSGSGQTLFFEPNKVAGLNEQLQDLNLSEKLEVLRILRELSATIAQEVDTLKENYRLLIELDQLFAEGRLAANLSANAIELTDTPTLALHKARHPHLVLQSGDKVVANNISTNPEQTGIIISGPNAGGKTVVLKTVGLLHLMAKAGLLIPTDRESKMYIFDNIHVELGDAQNLSANLSSFSGHLTGLKPIVESCGPSDLVLLDELAVGTEPQTGSAIAQAILEHIAQRKTTIVATTHFDALKIMAIENECYRNGSMEFNQDSLKPTYRLILDTPGQSYGIELAEAIGMPANILSRARNLRGATAMSLDHAINQMQKASSSLNTTEAKLKEELYAVESERDHWQQSREALEETRRKAAERVKSQFEAKLTKMTQEYDDLVKMIRKTIKHEQLGDGASELQALRQQGEKLLGGIKEEFDKAGPADDAPRSKGEVRSLDELAIGDRVFIIPLTREGIITQITPGHEAPVELAAGNMKLRVKSDDIRWLSQSAPKESSATKSSGKRKRGTSLEAPVSIQTRSNTIDVRGMDLDQATAAMWKFIDQSLMRGESGIFVVHGHGTDRLKTGLRHALENDSPYSLSFQAGKQEEGGDGVTIVVLR